MAATIDGIINEPSTDFLGKDGFYWWFGEVVNNRDPMQLGRVKVRIMGYYTGTNDKFKDEMPDDDLPWAVVLQPTNQAGVGSAGQSASGQLQQGSMVMGFFLDGQEAQSPVVMGVVRASKTGQSSDGTLIQSIFGGEFTNEAEANKSTGAQPTAEPANSPGPSTQSGTKGDTPTAKAVPNDVNPQQSAATASAVSTPIAGANALKSNYDTALKSKFEKLGHQLANIIPQGNGDLLDTIDGTITNLDKLTVGIKNLVGGIMSEALAALKELFLQQISSAIKAIKLAGFTGIPQIVTAAIQAIIQLVQQFVCSADAGFLSEISAIVEDPLGYLEDFIGQVIEQIFSAIETAFDSMVQNIICAINSIIDTLQNILAAVGSAVAIAKQVRDIIEKGTAFFENLEEISVQDISSITSIISLILGMILTQCDRSVDGASDQWEFIPFLGATKCDQTNPPLSSAGDCPDGDSTGGLSAAANIIQVMTRAADPFLTKVETALSGSSVAEYGTPGARGRIQRLPSGATWTSTKTNSKEQEAYEKEKASQEKGNAPKPLPAVEHKDTIVGDEIKFTGATDIKTKKDFALDVGGMMIQSIDGDYKLTIGGSLDIEVNGGFRLHVKDSPQTVDQTTGAATGGTKAQKNVILFDSDTEISSAGKLSVQGAGSTVASKPGTDVKMISDSYNITAPSLSINCTNDLKLAAGNAIMVDTPSLIRTINVPGLIPRAKAGIFTTCHGSYDMIVNPAVSAADAVPRYTVSNSAGPIAMTCAGTGMLLTVGAGALVATVAAGAMTLTATSGPLSIFSGSTMNLTATGIMQLTAPMIKLN